MSRRAAAVAAVAASLAFLFAGCSEPPAAPNVILISIDTLRADHMSLYGYERATTPALEAFAADAVVFDSFFNSGGATLKSHASLFTSLYPEAHGVDRRRPLGDAHVTLAERLRERGYRTAAFTDTVWLTEKFGLAQGFSTYDDTGGNAARILPEASRWLEGAAAPFFLFVHVFDVHSSNARLPYDSPDGYNELFTAGYEGSFDGCRDGRCASRFLEDVNRRIREGEIELADALGPEDLAYVVGLYDGGVRYVDAKLGEWIAWLRSAGLYEDALIVVLADHGEELGDHGLMLHGTPYEEFVRIPLIVKLPRSRHGGRRIPELASMIDVMPTVLDAVGIAPSEELQGRSLLPLVESGRAVREHVGLQGSSVRSHRWKLIESRRELFDLEADPREQRNVWANEPDVVRELHAVRDEIDDALATRPAIAPAAQRDLLSSDEVRQLRSLGYVE